ncbi:acyltransferase family protein [Paraglaciecola sp.]|uniref:acyltransferase family protein n=1 Tax=Paraglaciecola sp. TaxID=1920173 RepID=UPI00273F9FEA|nr:acyltransferase family protein [Paraglaciecola sp.]MDP5032079.1 acyltransferase [Paraglaciecola sp.]
MRLTLKPKNHELYSNKVLSNNWPASGYRADIQGLRALAVMLVIIFHADFHFLKGGYVGVDVFFVISGYLISGLLFKEIHSAGTIDFRRFYARRIRRILPLSVFVTLATLIFFGLSFSPIELRELSKTTLFTSLFSSNVWFVLQATDYFGSDTETNPLLHTWSLGVEEQFYFLWPALVALLPLFSANRKIWKWLVIVISFLSLLSFLYLFNENQPLAFFGMPTRAWQFGFGALIHFIPAYKRMGRLESNIVALIGLGCILFTSINIAAGFDGNPWWAILPTLGACGVIWAGQVTPNHLVYRLLSVKPIVFVGTLSYSLYLWHWPVLMYLKLDDGLLSIVDVIVGLTVVFLFSFLSYRGIENKLRSHRQLNSNLRSFVLGAVLVILGVGTSLVFYYYAKFSLNSVGQQKIAAVEFASKETRECIAKITESELANCVLGDVNGKISIVLLGDSKAQQWMPALSEIGLKNGWKIIPIIKAGCSPAYLNIFLGYLGREYKECNIWRDKALSRVIQQAPDVILFTHFSGYSLSVNGKPTAATESDWKKAYYEFGQKLLNTHSKLLFLRDNPGFPMDVPLCLSRAVRGGEIYPDMCEFATTVMDYRESVFHAAQDKLPQWLDARILDLSSSYCTADICPTFRNGSVRYTDNHHLSFEFTKELVWLIEDELNLILQQAHQPK